MYECIANPYTQPQDESNRSRKGMEGNKTTKKNRKDLDSQTHQARSCWRWSKIFHANATIKQRRNLISSIQDANGLPRSEHHIKAHILLEAFKEILGISDNPEMLFNLDELLEKANDLRCLAEPFTHEEIDAVVASLPSNKSPGPDGFNMDFIKKC